MKTPAFKHLTQYELTALGIHPSFTKQIKTKIAESYLEVLNQMKKHIKEKKDEIKEFEDLVLVLTPLVESYKLGDTPEQKTHYNRAKVAWNSLLQEFAVIAEQILQQNTKKEIVV